MATMVAKGLSLPPPCWSEQEEMGFDRLSVNGFLCVLMFVVRLPD